MDSPAWFRRRERWLAEYRATHGGADPVCAVCGEPWDLRRGQLHHRSYDRLGAELSRDLVPLCGAAHEALHALMDSNPAWRRLPREQATDVIVGYLRSRVREDQQR